MAAATRPTRFLLLAALTVALIVLPGAAYLLGSSQSPARRVPFANDGTGLGSSDVQGALAELAARVRAVESNQSAVQTATASQTSELSSLQTSSQDQAIRIAGQEARVATLESKLAESVSARRRLDYADEASSDSVRPDYARLRSLGSFSKLRSTTSLLLAWSTHVEAEGEPGTFCDFQLRIDGQPDSEWEGGGGRAVVYIPPGAGAGAASVSVSTLFARVGPGSHTVDVWVRGSARACRENPGNFPRSVLVEEGPRG